MKNQNKLFKIFSNMKSFTDKINIILGIAMVVFLVLASLDPSNKYYFGIVFLLGGALNVTNGFKYYRSKKTKSLGSSLIFMGMIILMIGAYIFSYLA